MPRRTRRLARTPSASAALIALLAGGCFLEAGLAYYPRVAQGTDAVLDSSGTELAMATEASTSAVGFQFRAGFYFDLPFGYRCAYGCAPYSVGISTGGARVNVSDEATAIEASNGRGTEVRVDADLGRHRGDYKWRGTASYTSVGSGDVYLRSGPTTMSQSPEPSGRALFAGLTLARKEHYAGLTVGAAHMSWDSVGKGSTPGTHVSATGAQLRLTFTLPSATVFKLVGIVGRYSVSGGGVIAPKKPQEKPPAPPMTPSSSGQDCTYTEVCTSRTDGRCETVIRCK